MGELVGFKGDLDVEKEGDWEGLREGDRVGSLVTAEITASARAGFTISSLYRVNSGTVAPSSLLMITSPIPERCRRESSPFLNMRTHTDMPLQSNTTSTREEEI